MTRGLGIDAVEIDRIRRARARFGGELEARILSLTERRALGESGSPDLFVAGRFAAKEAVMKVLGTGWARGVRFRDIEVLSDDGGCPRVTLASGAAARARALGIERVLVSITHTETVATAVALGEGAG